MGIENKTSDDDYIDFNDPQNVWIKFSELTATAESILQQEALRYLKTKDKDKFYKEFTGELDSEGFLIRKDGKTATRLKPSVLIQSKWALEEVTKMTEHELQKIKLKYQ